MAWGYGNLGSGGGSSSVFGIIVVNYPEGSTVTITGGRSTSKELSSTQKAYYVKEAGTYGLTAEDPMTGESTFKQVEISSLAQSVTITLSYRLYIVQNGIIQSGFSASGSYKKYSSNSNTPTTCNASYQSDYGRIYLYGSQQSTRSGCGYVFNDIKSIIYSNGELHYNYIYMDVEWDSTYSVNNYEAAVGLGYRNQSYGIDDFLSSSYRTVHNNSSGRSTHKYELNNSTIINASRVSPMVAFNVTTIGDTVKCRVYIYNIYLSNTSE